MLLLPSMTFVEYPSPISTNRQVETSPLSPLAHEPESFGTIKEFGAKTDGRIRSNGRNSNDFIIFDVKGTEFRVLGVRAALEDDVVEAIDGSCPTITQLGALSRPKVGS
jgi:hypothetical protein